MITMFEIHVKTDKSLSDILAHLKTKGIATDFKLCPDGDGKLKIKHPTSNSIHTYNVKVYKEHGDMIEYEFGAYTESEFSYLKDAVKDM